MVAKRTVANLKHRYHILVYRGREEGEIKARVDYGMGKDERRVYVGPHRSEEILLRDVAAVISDAEGRPDYTYRSSKLF